MVVEVVTEVAAIVVVVMGVVTVVMMVIVIVAVVMVVAAVVKERGSGSVLIPDQSRSGRSIIKDVLAMNKPRIVFKVKLVLQQCGSEFRTRSIRLLLHLPRADQRFLS